MKTKIFLFVALLFLNCTSGKSEELIRGKSPSLKGSINVYTSPDLYNMSVKWANEYSNLNPKLKIQVNEVGEAAVLEKIALGDGIGFIDSKSYPKSGNLSIWNMVVGRDVIVPIINDNNPLLDEINKKGISPDELAKLLGNKNNENWGSLLNESQNIPIHLYLPNDPSTLTGVANFLKINQSILDGVKTAGIQEMISAIQKDPNALGFCKLIQVTDLNNQSLIAGLKLVPIDNNGNGKLDYMENIYSNLQAFTRGVWIGKYPKALSGNIYSVSSEKPRNENELAFLNWIIRDGQQFLSSNGFSDLVYAERQTQQGKLDEPVNYTTIPVKSTNAFVALLLMVLVVIIASGIIVDLAFRRIRNRKEAKQQAKLVTVHAFDDESVIIPKGLYFDKTHTWAFMKKNGLVKVGIDDFLQHVTGKITKVDMKSTGDKIKKGDLLLSIIRKGKLLNIYSPISGTISEINKNLFNNSSLLNSAPYDEGWVYEIEPLNWSLEIQYLSIAEKYKTALKDEFLRLKEFFASIGNANSPELSNVVMQDGGALKDKPLAEFGPEVWDDFQTKFIDVSK